MTVFEMADQLEELRQEKARLEDELKKVKAEIEAVNEAMVAEMVSEEVQRFTRNGKLFYLQTDMFVSDVAERREALYETLRQQGYGDLIRETVHPQTLKGFTKEQVRENNDELPDWLDGFVNVFFKDKVVVRKDN